MSPGWDAVTPTPFKRAGLSVSRFNADADVDMMDMDCDVGGARTDPESTTKPRSIYDDWEGEDFAGVILALHLEPRTDRAESVFSIDRVTPL